MTIAYTKISSIRFHLQNWTNTNRQIKAEILSLWPMGNRKILLVEILEIRYRTKICIIEAYLLKYYFEANSYMNDAIIDNNLQSIKYYGP